MITVIFSLLAGAAAFATVLRISQVRAGVRAPLLVGISLAPFVVYFLLNAQYRVMFAHGFFHLGISYQIMNGGIPPMDPIFAGQPVLYPWGYHWLAASLSSISGIAPDVVFFLLAMFALGLTVMLVARTVSEHTHSYTTAVLAVLIAIFGVSIFNSGPVADSINRMMVPVLNMVDEQVLSRVNLDLPYHLSQFTLGERRVRLPIKYLQLEGSTFGVVFVALFVFSTMRIFSAPQHRYGPYLVFGLALLGAGFFYPMFWSGLIGSLAPVALAMTLVHGTQAARKIIAAFAIAGGTTLLLLPYLLQVTAGKPPEASIAITTNAWLIIAKLVRYAWGMLPLLLLIAWHRHLLVQKIREKDTFVICGLSMSLGTFAMYVLLSAPDHTEYKYYVLSWLSAGLVAALPMKELLHRKRFSAIALGTILLFPLSFDLVEYSLEKGPFTDPFYRDGVNLRHENRAEDNLYRFLLENTSPADIVVDSYLTVPVFAQRTLLIGTDLRRSQVLADQRALGDNSDIKSKPMDGWRNTAASFFKLHGYSDNNVQSRTQITSRLLSLSNEPLDINDIERLEKLAQDRAVVIVIRDRRAALKFEHARRFSQSYAAGDVAVFRFD